MPAMLAPTRKRNATNVSVVGANATDAALAAAPNIAAEQKNLRGSRRSAKPSSALARVPATKPSATPLDNAADCTPLKANCAFNTGTTDAAENHNDIARTSHNSRI